jgi:hypothetical protein
MLFGRHDPQRNDTQHHDNQHYNKLYSKIGIVADRCYAMLYMLDAGCHYAE